MGLAEFGCAGAFRPVYGFGFAAVAVAAPTAEQKVHRAHGTGVRERVRVHFFSTLCTNANVRVVRAPA